MEARSNKMLSIVENNIKEARDPDWAQFDSVFTHVHDWRTYVPPCIRDSWDDLSEETRCAVVAVGKDAADREEWD